jgi:hypothetical protein
VPRWLSALTTKLENLQVFDVVPDDYFVVMCCDGVYDVLDDDEVVQVNIDLCGEVRVGLV